MLSEEMVTSRTITPDGLMDMTSKRVATNIIDARPGTTPVRNRDHTAPGATNAHGNIPLPNDLLSDVSTLPYASDQRSGGDHTALRNCRNRRSRALKFATISSDTLAVLAAAAFAYSELGNVGQTAQFKYLSLSVIAPVIFVLTFAQQGLYVSRRISRRADELRRLFNAAALGTIVLAAASVLIDLNASSIWLITVGGISLVLAGAGREGLRRFITHQRASGRLARRVLLVGGNREADELLSMLSHAAELGYEVVGRISDESVTSGGPLAEKHRVTAGEPPWLGYTHEILEVAESYDVSGVIVATTDIDLETANVLVRQLTNAGIYIEMSSAMRDIASRRVTIRPLGRYPIMTVEPVVNNGWRAALKRCFDISLSVMILMILSPIMLLAALAIRITDGHEVFFRQTRVGRNGKEFTVFKLRTMVHNAEELLPALLEQNEAAGPMFKMTDDPRVTRVGSFLRKTSLDEVPQFLNVIRGEMSLVGPRPALPSEAEQWDDDLRERLRVKPGITGNWQVNGRFTASLEDYQRLDMFYVDNWSIITDLVILGKTIPAVLKRNGAA